MEHTGLFTDKEVILKKASRKEFDFGLLVERLEVVVNYIKVPVRT